MNNNILDLMTRLQTQDTSEKILIFKLFGIFLFVFLLCYFAFWFAQVPTPMNEFYGIKLTNAALALILATITVIVIALFVGKKGNGNP